MGGDGMKYQVLIHGSLWFESDNVLIADAYAHKCRENGWSKVEVKPGIKHKRPNKLKSDLLMEAIAQETSEND
jgi:hypothetical protein